MHLFPFQVADNFVPPLLDAVLLDYQKNVPYAREPEVLSTMASIVNKLEGHITQSIPQIFDAVFECTLDMINKNFEEYPEHRSNFFLLLQAVNSHCFAGKSPHLLPPASCPGSSSPSCFASLPEYPTRTIQAGAGLGYLGLQAYHA